MRNFFNEAFKFNNRCMAPCVVPIEYCTMYMIQSGNYMISPEFISTGRKMDLTEAQALWELVHDSGEATIELVCRLLFDPRSYGRNVSTTHYYSPHLQAL